MYTLEPVIHKENKKIRHGILWGDVKNFSGKIFVYGHIVVSLQRFFTG